MFLLLLHSAAMGSQAAGVLLCIVITQAGLPHSTQNFCSPHRLFQGARLQPEWHTEPSEPHSLSAAKRRESDSRARQTQVTCKHSKENGSPDNSCTTKKNTKVNEPSHTHTPPIWRRDNLRQGYAKRVSLIFNGSLEFCERNLGHWCEGATPFSQQVTEIARGGDRLSQAGKRTGILHPPLLCPSMAFS